MVIKCIATECTATESADFSYKIFTSVGSEFESNKPAFQQPIAPQGFRK